MESVPETDTARRRKRRTYPAEFKARIVLESIEGRKSLEDLSREYEVSPNQIKNWRTRMRQNLESIFVDKRRKSSAPDFAPADEAGEWVEAPEMPVIPPANS